MTEDLRISMIQSHIIWEDREENLGYYGELLRRVSGRTDLAVLPTRLRAGIIVIFLLTFISICLTFY